MTTALQIYGNREDVREIETRLEVLIVGGRALNPNERRALAQVAVAHGLDPFNGEAWIIPGSGPMIGIKGLRKLARRQLRREHGEASNFYINFFEIADPDQRKRYRIPEDALAFEARIYDTATISQYVETFKAFNVPGMETKTILAMIGEKPYTSGFGYYQPHERTKMTPIQVAQKRAEADALKRRFDVELMGLQVDVDNDDRVIEGQYAETGFAVETPAEREARNGDSAAARAATPQPTTNAPLRTVVQDLKADEPFGSKPAAPVEPPVKDWRAELRELGTAAGELVAISKPDIAADLSAAQSFAREVYAKNAKATESERGEARAWLQRAITAANEAIPA